MPTDRRAASVTSLGTTSTRGYEEHRPQSRLVWLGRQGAGAPPGRSRQHPCRRNSRSASYAYQPGSRATPGPNGRCCTAKSNSTLPGNTYVSSAENTRSGSVVRSKRIFSTRKSFVANTSWLLESKSDVDPCGMISFWMRSMAARGIR